MSKYEQFKLALGLAILAPTDAKEQQATNRALELLPWLSVRQVESAKSEVLTNLDMQEYIK